MTDKNDQGPSPIDRMRIESPCSMKWEALRGGDSKRFCDQCQLSVHNSAALTRSETEELLEARAQGARVCMRIERRPDGSPVHLDDGARRPRRTFLTRAASFGVVLAGGLLAACRRGPEPPENGTNPPPDPTPATTHGQHDPVELGDVELGDVAYPEPMMGVVAPECPTSDPVPADPEPVELVGEVHVEPPEAVLGRIAMPRVPPQEAAPGGENEAD